MNVYKLIDVSGVIDTVNLYVDGLQTKSIPFNPANTDYQNFKSQINADEAQLESADGVVMTAQEAKDFVASLP